MDGKRKRKSGISPPEVPLAKASFDCRQVVCVSFVDEEDDGVHGCRMKPLASLQGKQHVLHGRDVQGGFSNSKFTKKTVSPSAVTAAARLTARAREKARMCLLEDNKENAFPNGAEGFGPFRGSKLKGTHEGFHETAPQSLNTDSPRKVLDASKLETEAANGGRDVEANRNEEARERRQSSCLSSSVQIEPSQVLTVSLPTSQWPSYNGNAGTGALCLESLRQNSQDSSNSVPLVRSSGEPEFIASAPVPVAENARQGNGETCVNGHQHPASLMDSNQVSTTTVTPVALALNAAATLSKLGPNPMRQIRKVVFFGRMQLASPTSTSKHPSPGSRGDGKPNALDLRSHLHASSSHALPSKLGMARNGAVSPASGASHQSTCNLSHQHVADISKLEISGHSTITVPVNPDLARQSTCMSSSQPLSPTVRKPRVFKAGSDSLDGDQLPCLQNLECKAPPGEVRTEMGTLGRAFPDTGLNDKPFPYHSRCVPRYLSSPRQISLSSRQRTSSRVKKTGYSKFRPVSLDSAKDVRKDNKRPAAITEPAGLLGDFNPGIISRIRDSKQVQAILGAVVGSDAMEATASFRLQRKPRQQPNTAVSNCERTEPLAWILPSRLNERKQDGVNTASANGMRDRKENFAIGATGHSQAEISSCHQGTNHLQQPNFPQEYLPSYESPKAEDITTDHRGIPGTKGNSDKCKMPCPSDGSRSSEYAFPMDPTKSCAVATVASRWLELVGMDIKGRLAALKRSRRRFRNVICSGELDDEVRPFEVRGPETELQASNHHAPPSNQWKTLFVNMDGLLSAEGGKLESSLKQVIEMQVNCRQALEQVCDPSAR